MPDAHVDMLLGIREGLLRSVDAIEAELARLGRLNGPRTSRLRKIETNRMKRERRVSQG